MKMFEEQNYVGITHAHFTAQSRLLHLPAQYDLEDFLMLRQFKMAIIKHPSCLHVKLKTIEGNVQIFRTGLIRVLAAHSKEEARSLLRKVARAIQTSNEKYKGLAMEKITYGGFKYVVELGYPVRLLDVVSSIPDASYEPEIDFPVVRLTWMGINFTVSSKGILQAFGKLEGLDFNTALRSLARKLAACRSHNPTNQVGTPVIEETRSKTKKMAARNSSKKSKEGRCLSKQPSLLKAAVTSAEQSVSQKSKAGNPDVNMFRSERIMTESQNVTTKPDLPDLKTCSVILERIKKLDAFARHRYKTENLLTPDG